MFTIDAWYFTSRCLTLLFCFKILLQTTVHFLKTVSWWHLRERTTSPVLKEGIGSIQLYMSLIQLPLNWIIVLTSCYIMYFVKSELIKMTRAWDKEKSESPTRIEPIPSRTLGGRSIHWGTRTHGEQGHLTEFMCDRRPAYCQDQHHRSHRDCEKRIKWIKMRSFVRFLSGTQIFCLSHARVWSAGSRFFL